MDFVLLKIILKHINKAKLRGKVSKIGTNNIPCSRATAADDQAY